MALGSALGALEAASGPVGKSWIETTADKFGHSFSLPRRQRIHAKHRAGVTIGAQSVLYLRSNFRNMEEREGDDVQILSYLEVFSNSTLYEEIKAGVKGKQDSLEEVSSGLKGASEFLQWGDHRDEF